MNQRTYDRTHASQLVPMLRSIMTEILERTGAIETLEARLETRLQDRANAGRDRDVTQLRAQIAEHRRQLRLATRELARFGCAIDQDHPARVLIPGETGELLQGYRWSPLDETLTPVGAE